MICHYPNFSMLYILVFFCSCVLSFLQIIYIIYIYMPTWTIVGCVCAIWRCWCLEATLLYYNCWDGLCSICFWHPSFVSFKDLAWIFNLLQPCLHHCNCSSFTQRWYLLFQLLYNNFVIWEYTFHFRLDVLGLCSCFFFFQSILFFLLHIGWLWYSFLG